MRTALIGDIGRHRTSDGPGIRTVVFFKGCPFHCPWCHNPEFIAPQPELAFYPNRCTACGECLQRCPRQALTGTAPPAVDRLACDCCGDCAAVCPTGALAVVGQRLTVEEVVEVVLRDRLYYQASGGGVTLSGGEPTMQMAFASLLLRQLKENAIHTALETNGFFRWQDFAELLLPWLDLVLFDLKIADSARHREVTGQANEGIFRNLQKLLEGRHEVVVRIPLIPGYTADGENLAGLAAWMRRQGVRQYALLPYHPYGRSKAAKIGQPVDRSLPDRSMSAAAVEQWRHFFEGF